ncbi:MAG TPA: CapA family protein [Candidatus Saccharibacteria bacterium]|nr:CapA family protein [Candidatus Saccharibacteria bacterium]HMR38373.1 CapA family protein [Candidatus Saccharibacteria bacterium]
MKLRRNSRGMRWLIIVLVLAAAIVVTYSVLSKQNSRTPEEKTDQQANIPKEHEPQSEPSLQFAAMGDMLAHDSVVNQAKTASSYDFLPYFASIRQLYKDSEVVFCNPETPAAGSEFGISGYPTFNAPLEFSRDLSEAGCNLINFANNHIADKGAAALKATLDAWDKLQPLAITGANRTQAEQNTVRYFEKNGLKVAFVAFADFSNAPLPHSYSVNLYHDETVVTQLLTEARKNADAVVVSAHWGTEDSHEVNQDQKEAARLFSRLGADVVIGTGPHVLQGTEMITRDDGQSTLVWYSIGNMLSSQLQVDQLTGGIAKFTLTKKEGKMTISDIVFEPTLMSYEWSAADKAADRLDKRSNLKLQPLRTAKEEAVLFGVTVEERYSKVRQWLGGSAGVKIL